MTGGSPVTGRKFVRLSLSELGRRLKHSAKTVRRLLAKWGFALRVNFKRFTGPPHPDRDRQFQYLRKQREKFLAAGDPVLSVDTKKKELIGEFKNAGRTYRRTAYEVNAHDFPHDAACKAVPYGVYDLTHNAARIAVGTSGDTGEFAVAAIRSWWQASGRTLFPNRRRLLIEADAGGSNGCRPRLWKRALQEFADKTGLEITVCHYPTGASKWNPIEHRVFGPITINWSGEPLTSLKKLLSLIRGTTTETGLTITAAANTKTYPIHLKVSNADINALNLRRHDVCPQWNYTIKPRSAKNTE